MKNKFLDKVAEQIADERSRKLITAELESHLLDKRRSRKACYRRNGQSR